MTYLSFIERQRDVINTFEQIGFEWRASYDSSFLDRVSQVNNDFSVATSSLPNVLNRTSVRNIFQLERDLYKGFVACMLWGGINAKRCAKGHSNDKTTTDAYRAFTIPKKEIMSKLKSVKSFLDNNQINEAFLSMENNRENHIPGIGVSFFTKLLFFLAPVQTDIHPLIFDKWSSYIHCALLIDSSDREVKDYYKGVNKEGILIKAKADITLYKDYLKIMKETAKNIGLNDVSRLEAFLFGCALNIRGHREEKERRHFLKNYILDYWNSNNAKPRIKLLKEEKVPGRDNSKILKKYRIAYQGSQFYAFAGNNGKGAFCEVWSPSGVYHEGLKIEAKGLRRAGRKKPYFIKYFRKEHLDEAVHLLEQITRFDNKYDTRTLNGLSAS